MPGVLTIGEWKPDVSDHNGASTGTLSNVLPRLDGYGPAYAASVYSQALPARCRGLFFGTKTDGTVSVFAGTETKLYKLDNTTLDWTDVSLGAGTYSALSSQALWSFAQFNDKVIAVQANVAPQVFDINAGTAFAALGGSPPQAAYVTVINRFLVLSGLSSNLNRVQWSGLNAITTWTSGITYSDYQDLPDGGSVMNVIGGEFGLIIQDSAIRRMVWSPGADYVFQIDRLSKELGGSNPYQIVESAGRVFLHTSKGFYSIDASGTLDPIGRETVDRTYLAAYDASDKSLLQAAPDPRSNRVWFGYCSTSNSHASMDAALVYDYVLKRWAPVTIDAEMITTLAKPGVTLEGLATIGAINVTGAANNGSGLVRLAVTSTSGWATGDIKTVASVGGTTEANGTWTVTVIDGTHIDLQGSTYANAYTSGGYVEGSIDALGVSLDDFEAATRPDIAIVNADSKLAFFTGTTLEATVTTAEQSAIDKRLFVRGVYPVTDSTTVYASIGRRESMAVTPSYTDETLLNAQGYCPQRASTRHARVKLRIPAGTSWTYVSGAQPDVTSEGRR